MYSLGPGQSKKMVSKLLTEKLGELKTVKIPCLDKSGTEDIAVSDEIFGRAYNEPLVHQLINAYLANGRSGTRAQKGRSDVSMSTRKQWRQKGTGRARTGSAANPLWRGGGKIFPSQPSENFSHKINRKMYRAGLCCILSRLVRDGRLKVSNEFAVDQPKTRDLVHKLSEYSILSAMIVTDIFDSNLYLAARNIPNVTVLDLPRINPVSLLRHENIIFTREAILKIEGLI